VQPGPRRPRRDAWGDRFQSPEGDLGCATRAANAAESTAERVAQATEFQSPEGDLGCATLGERHEDPSHRLQFQSPEGDLGCATDKARK